MQMAMIRCDDYWASVYAVLDADNYMQPLYATVLRPAAGIQQLAPNLPTINIYKKRVFGRIAELLLLYNKL